MPMTSVFLRLIVPFLTAVSACSFLVSCEDPDPPVWNPAIPSGPQQDQPSQNPETPEDPPVPGGLHPSLSGYDYVLLALDEVSKSSLEGRVKADYTVDGVNSFLYIWEDTYSAGTSSGTNFYGISEGWTSLRVGSKGWSGAGWNVSNPASLPSFTGPSADLTSWVFHIAYKGAAHVPHTVVVYWAGEEYKFVIGQGSSDGRSAIRPVSGTFVPGGWNEYEVSLSQMNLPFSERSGGNICAVLSGSTPGVTIDVDAIFFYRKGKGQEDDQEYEGLSDENHGYETLQAKSPKRGVSYNFGVTPQSDIPLLGPAISWTYNWGVAVGEPVYRLFKEHSVDYCPMLWNTAWSESTLENFRAIYPEYCYLLAYNEPNLTDQASMTPKQAAADWPRVLRLAASAGMKIVSPAMNYGTLSGYHDPVKWLDEFFAQPSVSVDDVEAIAVHSYMGSVASVQGYLDKFRKYGKPLWLTEFCKWDSDKVTESSQMEFMVEMINALEADEDVQRYAWFIPKGSGASAVNNYLITSAIPTSLTDLGLVFVNMSTQDESLWYKRGQVIPAEHYNSCSGPFHLAPCSDSKGVLELTDLTSDSSVSYQVEMDAAGVRTLKMRFSTPVRTSVTLSVDGSKAVTLPLPSTANLWKTMPLEITLPEGRSVITVSGASDIPLRLNWLLVQ